MRSYHSQRWYQKWWGVLIIIFIIFFLIVSVSSLLYYNQMIKKIVSGEVKLNSKSGEAYNPKTIREGEAKYSLGKKEAPLTIVVFEDFNCPYCKEGFFIMKELYLQYPDSIRIIHRDFPLVSLDSPTLAVAARCAGEQGRFWLMAEIMFKNQGTFSISDLPNMAESVGIEKNQFSACLEEQRYLNEVQKDLEDASMLEVEATPVYLFNEYRASGLLPKETFKQTIETMLKNLTFENSVKK